MVANYEVVKPVSIPAAADYTLQTGTLAQYCFASLTTAPISVPGPSRVDRFGYAAPYEIVIDAGAAKLNTVAGGPCVGVINGAAKAGQPIEVGVGGRLLVMVGNGGLVAGAKVASDANGHAVAAAGAAQVLGTADGNYPAGAVGAIFFDQAGPFT